MENKDNCNGIPVLLLLYLQILDRPLTYGALNRTTGLDRIPTSTSLSNPTLISIYLVEQRSLLKEG